MAQYWWSAADASVGSGLPAGWTNRFATSQTHEVITDATSPEGQSWRIATSASTGRRLFTLDAVDADTDRADGFAAVLFKYIDVSSNNLGFGVAMRGAGSAGSETSMVSSTSRSTTTQHPQITRYVTGTSTALVALSDGSWSLTVGDWYWLVQEFRGSDVTLTLRTSAAPETVILTRSTTSATPSAAGWVGLFTFANSMTWDVAAFSVATGADSLLFEAPSADVTAPVLSSPTGTTTGATTADGTVTTDEANGTLYAVVTASATPPSAADIRAGTGAVYSTSQAVSTTGVQNVSATGLTAETTYYWHFLHDDAADNASNIVTSASFTTDAAVAAVKGVRVRLYDDADASAASITGIQCAWFDQPEPKDALAPVFKTSTASTDASGWLELNIDSATALAVGANGFLIAYKLDATNHQDSAAFAGRLAVEDIA